MEVTITNSNLYHEAIVTDKETANLLFNMHWETATMQAIHHRNTFIYKVTWLKHVGDIQPNVDDNLFIQRRIVNDYNKRTFKEKVF